MLRLRKIHFAVYQIVVPRLSNLRDVFNATVQKFFHALIVSNDSYDVRFSTTQFLTCGCIGIDGSDSYGHIGIDWFSVDGIGDIDGIDGIDGFRRSRRVDG